MLHQKRVDADPVFTERHEKTRNCVAQLRNRQYQLDDAKQEDWNEPKNGIDRHAGEEHNATQVLKN